MVWDQPFQDTAITANAPCVSLFHRNGRVGCSASDRVASKGMLVHASTLDAAQWEVPQPWIAPPLVLVLEEQEFHLTKLQFWMQQLQQVLRGVLVLRNATLPSNYFRNPASPYPLGTSSSSYAWNTFGDDLIEQDMYGMPILYTLDFDTNEDIRSVAIQQTNRLVSYNNLHSRAQPSQSQTIAWEELEQWQDTSLYPAMVAELDLYMGPQVMDSPTCLEWKDADAAHTWNPKCLPLGGNSVWASTSNIPKPVLLVATNMDATSMFHDRSPGANTAAANILVLAMTARLLGQVDPSILSWDSLSKQVVLAAFQGENFGRIGSMSFLQDSFFPGFQCQSSHFVSTSTPHSQPPQAACLYPLRHDLAFTSLASNGIDSMIAVDQLGLLQTSNTFYIHDNAVGTSQNWIDILSNLSSMDDSWNITQSSTSQTTPPSAPLLSLQQLSTNSVGGVLLTGYDSAFVDTSYYMSHLDSHSIRPLNLKVLAKSSTLLARAIVAYAAASDSQSSVELAMNVIPELNDTDPEFIQLSHCLLEDGYCNLFLQYAKMQQANTLAESGVDLGLGTALGKPPNYYPSIYDASNGQGRIFLCD
jgi:nicastrin